MSQQPQQQKQPSSFSRKMDRGLELSHIRLLQECAGTTRDAAAQTRFITFRRDSIKNAERTAA